MTRFRQLALTVYIALGVHTMGTVVIAQSTTSPRYLDNVIEEVNRLQRHVTCEPARGKCVIRAFTGKSNDELPPTYLVLDDITATVYIYIDLLLAPLSPPEPSHQKAIDILKLNTRLMAARIEWRETDNSLRLSTVLHTDSNFDRKAFRSILTGLWHVYPIVKNKME